MSAFGSEAVLGRQLHASRFLDKVVGALIKVEADAFDNIRLYMGNALDVLERLPDPWPKARQAKRRFMNAGPITPSMCAGR